MVLDEVDQMLDMGFAEQVEEILASSYKKGKFIVLCLALSLRTCAVYAVILTILLICGENDEPFVCARFSVDADTNPQTLLFSATCPPWVYDVAKKYMRPKCKHVDLIGKKTQKAATTVEVSLQYVCVCGGHGGGFCLYLSLCLPSSENYCLHLISKGDCVMVKTWVET